MFTLLNFRFLTEGNYKFIIQIFLYRVQSIDRNSNYRNKLNYVESFVS